MSNDKKGKILILSNHHQYTYNFRKEVIQKILDEGYEVYVTFPYGQKAQLLEEMGCKYIESPLDRRGLNPKKDLKLIKSYYHMIRRIHPDIVLSYTIKPNIYGGLVCRALKIPFIANVTGLGTAIGNASLLQKALIQLYKSAFKKADCVFFQNETNKNFFIKNNIPLENYQIIPGSGINIHEFQYKTYPSENKSLKFLFIGRIMRDKGIEELIQAARQIKKEYANVQFDALGFCEDEYREKVEELQKENIINFHGAKDNVQEYIANCNVVVHPTYHEGMSNVLLEAAATGRPVLASNIPGCKEIFDEGVSGLGFAPRDADSLASAIKKFINLSTDEKVAMGVSGRKKIKKEFNREIVVNAYLNEINKIMEAKQNEFIQQNS